MHNKVAAAIASAVAVAVLAPAAHAARSDVVMATHRVRAPIRWTARPPQYAATATTKNLQIRMSDGTILRADLTRPVRADGSVVSSRLPVVVTIGAYNKDVPVFSSTDPSYLVRRGYVQLTVDARGTGSSAGQWCAFCAREDQDAVEILNWAHRQAWSNGRTAMDGASYMGIDQFFAAAGHPTGLKAIFPVVPAYDVYRDVAATGGQADVGFIPLWLGIVTSTGLVPPATPSSNPLGDLLGQLSDRTKTLAGFTAPFLLQLLFGQQNAYDGPFYQQRSPGSVVSRVNVPTFIVGGEYDLFQRGEPMLFDNLQRRGVPTKIIIGPWNHLQAPNAPGLAPTGYGTLDELRLRWFDHYVKSIPDPTLNADISNLTYYEIGSGTWRHENSYLGPDRRALQYNLSGTSWTAGPDGDLTTSSPQPGAATMYPIAVAGVCTRSTDQWTAGFASAVPLPNPCLTDNSLNDAAGVVFRTPPLMQPLRFQGPINAHLAVSSTTGDGLLSVALEDEAPDGTVTRLTGGWQVISLSALDTSRSRYLGGQLIQPYHPFTQESQQTLAPGQVAPVDVEVFPTGAAIQPGHRLRIAVQSFDLPHLLAPLPSLLGTLGVTTIHTGPSTPSWVELPAVG